MPLYGVRLGMERRRTRDSITDLLYRVVGESDLRGGRKKKRGEFLF